MVKAQFWYHEITVMQNAKCAETNALNFSYAYPMRWSVGQIWGWVGSRRSKSALLLLLRVTVLLLAHSTEFHDSRNPKCCLNWSTSYVWFNLIPVDEGKSRICSQIRWTRDRVGAGFKLLLEVCRPASVINTCFHSDKIRRRDFWPHFHKTE